MIVGWNGPLRSRQVPAWFINWLVGLQNLTRAELCDLPMPIFVHI